MIRAVLTSAFCVLLSACATFGSGPAPVYGCWCGKNQPPRGENPTPVDAWDEACMSHDLCYRRYGRDNRGCDITFIERIQTLALMYGYAPGQMQAAHSYFLSRLYGTTHVQGWFTMNDIVTWIDAGNCDLD